MSSTDSNAGSQDLANNNSNNSININSNNNSSHPSQDADLSLIITSANDNNGSNSLLASDTPGLSTASSTNNSASSSPRSVVRKRQRLTSSRIISALDGYPAGSSSATSSTSGGSVDKRSTLGPLLADRISSLSSDFHWYVHSIMPLFTKQSFTSPDCLWFASMFGHHSFSSLRWLYVIIVHV